MGNRSLVRDAPGTEDDQGTTTVVHVVIDGRYAGTILLADTLRGLRPMMLTRDQEATAKAVAAELGIAMGSGTDIARESSDVVLISSDLNDLVHTVHVARRARRIVMFNFAGTIAVDVVGMSLAAVGLLSPVAAAFSTSAARPRSSSTPPGSSRAGGGADLRGAEKSEAHLSGAADTCSGCYLPKRPADGGRCHHHNPERAEE